MSGSDLLQYELGVCNNESRVHELHVKNTIYEFKVMSYEFKVTGKSQDIS